MGIYENAHYVCTDSVLLLFDSTNLALHIYVVCVAHSGVKACAALAWATVDVDTHMQVADRFRTLDIVTTCSLTATAICSPPHGTTIIQHATKRQLLAA